MLMDLLLRVALMGDPAGFTGEACQFSPKQA